MNEYPARRRALCAALIAGLTAPAAIAAQRHPGFGAEQHNASINAEISQDLPPGRLQATLLCLDGFRFAVTAILGHGAAATPAIGMTQVYEERDGRVVPASCAKP